jgi:carbon starvation protein
MNSILLVGVCFFLFYMGYRFYGGFLERRLIEPKEGRTPAHELRDEVDYTPAKTPMLFGNHFASIAGAGPIIGPLIALANFGWLPTALWIVFGAIFLGAMHDYLSLMISIREKGESMAQVAERCMGYRAKLIFSAFLWLALILVISVFGVVGAKTLIVRPQVVLPTFAVIPIAMLTGYLVYRCNLSLFPSTLLALGLLFGVIYLGSLFPLHLPTLFGLEPLHLWFILLMLYCFIASLLPIWLLMQPRDYLCLSQLLLCLGIGYAGVFVAYPTINAPLFTSTTSPKGPIWPMLFVIIACGAISGFHSLVAAGTTSKQLSNERSGKLIGYGGMIMEGVLAVLCLIVASAGLIWGRELSAEEFGLQASLERGWIYAFGNGYGRILTEAFPFLSFGMASLFGMMMIKTFVMTSLDDGTRLARFIISETLGKRWSFLRIRVVGSLLTIGPAFLLGYSDVWRKVWPVFGAANQLIAALTLVVISSYLIGLKKPTIFTAVPAIFMIVTTMGALLWMTFNPQTGFLLEGNFTLGVTSIALFLLAGFLVIEWYSSWRKRC